MHVRNDHNLLVFVLFFKYSLLVKVSFVVVDFRIAEKFGILFIVGYNINHKWLPRENPYLLTFCVILLRVSSSSNKDAFSCWEMAVLIALNLHEMKVLIRQHDLRWLTSGRWISLAVNIMSRLRFSGANRTSCTRIRSLIQPVFTLIKQTDTADANMFLIVSIIIIDYFWWYTMQVFCYL